MLNPSSSLRQSCSPVLLAKVATVTCVLYWLKLKLIKIKENLKFSYSVGVATFQGLKSHETSDYYIGECANKTFWSLKNILLASAVQDANNLYPFFVWSQQNCFLFNVITLRPSFSEISLSFVYYKLMESQVLKCQQGENSG